MKLLVINGPNLNLLGLREPAHYGTENYQQLLDKIQKYSDEKGHSVSFFQSNHEGALVDAIQQAYFDGVEGIVINPAAYTHTSVAILDAVKSVSIPTVEVHISKVEQREAFRQVSYIRAACVATVSGLGTDGYLRAIDRLEEYYASRI
ncbi:MAG: type II 3-dehydroquinate dehydratase [Clostridia bacterium]|nr:type II 3-dehydroquinate dehydratase [Clostridia bacterium]